MTHHHSTAGARVRTVRQWATVHVRRHLPFAVYAALTAVLMVWTVVYMARLG